MAYEGENPTPAVVEESEKVVEPVAPPAWESAIKDVQINFTQQMQTLQQQIVESMGRFNPVPQPAEPTVSDASDDELEQVVASGQGRKKLRQMVQAEMAKLKREHIDPLQDVGLGAIARLTSEVSKRDMPHYDRFKKEIDSKINSVAPASRLNPEIHQLAYKAVLGEHVDELIKEATEAAIRKQAGTAQDGTGSSGRGDGIKGGKQTGLREDFGESADQALKSIGRDPDQFAKGLGYKNYQDYREKTKEYA